MSDRGIKDVLVHPLFVAFMTAIFTAVAGWFFADWKFKNSPPVAKIIPSNASINASEIVTFTANSSTDPENGELQFVWHVNGHPYDSAVVASCDKKVDESMIECRFASPGIHCVSVTVIDERKASNTASASVSIKLPGGYVAFVIKSGQDKTDLNLTRAFNYAVDWPKVQTLLRGKPIVLFDPDKGDSVFALDFNQSIDSAKEYFNLSEQSRFLKIIGQMPPAAVEQITMDLLKIGISATFVGLPMGEVAIALERGLGESGVVFLSDINELKPYYKQ